MTYIPDSQRQEMDGDVRGFTSPCPRIVRNAWLKVLDIAVRILTLNSGRVIANNLRSPIRWADRIKAQVG